jgi:hypothetical protein
VPQAVAHGVDRSDVISRIYQVIRAIYPYV